LHTLRIALLAARHGLIPLGQHPPEFQNEATKSFIFSVRSVGFEAKGVFRTPWLPFRAE